MYRITRVTLLLLFPPQLILAQPNTVHIELLQFFLHHLPKLSFIPSTTYRKVVRRHLPGFYCAVQVAMTEAEGQFPVEDGRSQ